MLSALSLAIHVGAQAAQQLFSHAASAILAKEFPQPAISYLLMDRSGAVLAQRWRSPDAIPPGSLVKPFLAVAFGEQHGERFPVVRCRGTRSLCWRPDGHGSLGLEDALAQSCNAYFLALAQGLDHNRAAQVFTRYGLAGPLAGASDEDFVGSGHGWKEMPGALARAYLMLVHERGPAQNRIVAGMQGSAEHGTARAVDAVLGRDAALAKTGTAPCTHTPHAPGDGFTVVLYPAVEPRLVLLVREHGTTGAETAKIAGEMLRSLGLTLK